MCIRDAVDSYVARENALIAVHPVVVERAVALTDTLIVSQRDVIALTLSKITHPHIV